MDNIIKDTYRKSVLQNKVNGNDFITEVLIRVFLKREDEVISYFFVDKKIVLTNIDQIISCLINDVREENEDSLWSDISTDDELLGYTRGFIFGVFNEYCNLSQETLEDSKENKGTIKEYKIDRDFSHFGKNRFKKLDNNSFILSDDGDTAIPLLKGDERSVELNRVSDAIDSSISYRIDSAYNGDKTVHLLKAPTGSGKTSRIISALVSDPRTYDDIRTEGFSNIVTNSRKPILILMPNHHNILEAVSRAKMLCLNPNLPNNEMCKELVKCGYSKSIEHANSQLDDVRLSIRMCGRDPNLPALNISVMQGRERGGCKKKEELNLLKTSGIGQSSLCQARERNQETDEMETKYCEFYNECPFIREREKLKYAHIVFMPHSYLTISTIPDEIKNPRLVVIDERIQEQVLKYEFMSLTGLMETRKRTLDSMRYNPTMPEDEEGQAKYFKRQEALANFNRKEAGRSWCAHILNECSKVGHDPANFFLEKQREYIENGTEITHNDNILPSPLSCLNLAVDALVEISKRDPRIKPGIDLELLEIICSTPKTESVDVELKLWQTIRDRISRIKMDEERNNNRSRLEKEWLQKIQTNKEDENLKLTYELAMNEFDEKNPLKSNGDRDMRLQMLHMRLPNGDKAQNVVRVSWRNTVNWIGCPVLLLDASAYEEIIKKIWLNTNVITTNVVSDFGKLLNIKIVSVIDHTWSNSSLLSSATSSFGQRVTAGISLASIRDACSVISANHSDGRVLFGSNKGVRKALQHNWIPPINMDTSHYGAIRGIDVWKNHSATMSVGRMDLPNEAIDAMAACLTWDDLNPELPFNINGNGFADIECEVPLFQDKYIREIRMRDGRKATFSVPMVSGYWGQLCQKQAREEELLQFLGRLRPIYRNGKTPIHYAFSSVIPEGLILDDCVTIHDIIGDDNMGFLRKDKIEYKIKTKWQEEREVKAIMTRIIDTSVRIYDGIFCPEVLASDYVNLDILSRYRTSESIFNIMNKCGFNLNGEMDLEQSMADGWSLYSYSIAGDIIKPVWLQSSIYKTEEESMQSIANLLVEYLNCDGNDIEISPYHIIYPEKDILPSSDIIGEELENNALEKAYDVNSFVDILKSIILPATHNNIGKDITYIDERSCENKPTKSSRKKYYITEELANYMVPEDLSIIRSKKSIEKDKELMKKYCDGGLYFHQILGVMSLQDIYGPSVSNICDNIKGIVGTIKKEINLENDIVLNNIVKRNSSGYSKLDNPNYDDFAMMCIGV